jgi:hypothetical protein
MARLLMDLGQQLTSDEGYWRMTDTSAGRAEGLTLHKYYF